MNNSMKCIFCKGEWPNVIKAVFCPFCGKELLKNIDLDTVPKAIKYMLQENGVDIINNPNRLYGFICDVLKGCEKEKRFLNTLRNEKGAFEIIKELLECEDEDIPIIIEKYKKLYIEEYLANEKYTMVFLQYYLEATEKNYSLIDKEKKEGIDRIKEEKIERNDDKDNDNDILFISAKTDIYSGNRKHGLEEMIKMAQEGSEIAQFFLGALYNQGRYVPKSNVEAIKWYMMAADQGNIEAQFRVGYIYYLSVGIKSDKIKAIEWFEKAYKNGHGKAAFYMASMYESGDGVEKNYLIANVLYRKSFALGYQSAESGITRTMKK